MQRAHAVLTMVTNDCSMDSIQTIKPPDEGTELEKDTTMLDSSKTEEGPVIGDPEPPYSIFSKGEKRFITFIMSLTTLFPPLTASMYYPVITKLASELDVSINAINLTITAYLIFQGLAPSFIGNLSDEIGRRPALVVCFIVYIVACIALALKGTYVALMITRCLQSSGSSGTIALAFATVSDIVTSAQRGSYISFVQMGWMVGPALGPVLGGVLSQYLGWRSIFWFLTIFASVVLTICLVFLPETSRKIVGNGSVPSQKWNMSLLTYIHMREQRKAGNTTERKSSVNFKAQVNPLSSLKLFSDKETCIFLLYSGLIYATQYMILSSMPAQLQEKHGFDTLQISLCYLATGSGIIAAVIFVGPVLDWNFRRHAKRLGIEISNNKQQDLKDFPIEWARLQVSLPLLSLAAATLVAYGWTMQARTSLAAPMIFLFLSTFGNSSSFSGFSSLIVDLNREKPGTTTAAMNLARCWMGAAGVAIVTPLTNAVGIGWTTVIIAGSWLAFSPTVFWAIKCGPGWREEKRLRNFSKQEAQG